MTWNHRIMRHVHGEDVFYQIHEVHYDAAGNVEHWSEEPVGPFGDTRADLLESFAKIGSAFLRPILDGGSGAEIYAAPVDIGDVLNAVEGAKP